MRKRQTLDAMDAVMNSSPLLSVHVCHGEFLWSLSFTELVHSIFLVFYNVNYHTF